MKRLLSIFAIAITLVLSSLAISSCKSTNYEPLYAVEVVGDADGNVNVTFPQGILNVDGTAGLNFNMANDTTVVNKAKKVVSLEEALTMNDAEVVEAAEKVDEMFTATAASGTYAVTIKGYVKEPVTGITFSIDRTFTNR